MAVFTQSPANQVVSSPNITSPINSIQNFSAAIYTVYVYTVIRSTTAYFAIPFNNPSSVSPAGRRKSQKVSTYNQ